MAYDTDALKNILKNLKEDPMRIIYTEHCLEQIEKRKIPEECVEEALENENPASITPIENLIFELHYHLNNSTELYILARPFNLDKIILISARTNNESDNTKNNALKFKRVYDFAFDLLNIHSKYGFRHFQTIEIESKFDIDFDSCGHPIGIEIIHPSKKFKLTAKQFSSAKLNGQIEITKNSIKIHLKATLNNENIHDRVLEKEIPNIYGIQENAFDLIIENQK